MAEDKKPEDKKPKEEISALNQQRVPPDLEKEGYNLKGKGFVHVREVEVGKKGETERVPRENPDGSQMQRFYLKIVKDDPMGKTHKLKSETHFWEGNAAEFRRHFEAA